MTENKQEPRQKHGLQSLAAIHSAGGRRAIHAFLEREGRNSRQSLVLSQAVCVCVCVCERESVWLCSKATWRKKKWIKRGATGRRVAVFGEGQRVKPTGILVDGAPQKEMVTLQAVNHRKGIRLLLCVCVCLRWRHSISPLGWQTEVVEEQCFHFSRQINALQRRRRARGGGAALWLAGATLFAELWVETGLEVVVDGLRTVQQLQRREQNMELPHTQSDTRAVSSRLPVWYHFNPSPSCYAAGCLLHFSLEGVNWRDLPGEMSFDRQHGSQPTVLMAAGARCSFTTLMALSQSHL